MRGHKKQRDAAFAILPQANAEFQTLCNPQRFFTRNEATGYRMKYKETYTTIKEIDVDKFIKCYAKKSVRSGQNSEDVRTFVNNYKNIDELREFNNIYIHRINRCNREAQDFYELLLSKLPDTPKISDYFTSSDCHTILESHKELIDAINLVYPRFKEHITFPDMQSLDSLIQTLEEKRLEYNHKVYVPYLLEDNTEYFDSLLPFSLDSQQRNAIVTDEDNILVISSAGSGKTSTIIAKARYLIDKHKVDPRKLLILTYTRKAALQLKDRLGNDDVACSTFHSLACSILSTLENRRPSICEASLLLNVFRNLLQSDHNFLKAVLRYILHLQSLMKLEHEYDRAPDYYADRKKFGIQAPYPDMRGNIIFTKSEEEKRICTLLTELGVRFLYEEPYPFTTYTPEHRQYKPDFTIVVQDPVVDPVTGVRSFRERRVYLEHFAVDAHGNVPRWFGDRDIYGGGWVAQNRMYNEGILWKRALHMEKNTVLIETRSADFHSGQILEVLKKQLESANVPINPPTPEELYERLIRRSQKIESVYRLLEQFIALLKSNNGSIQPIIDKAKQRNDKRTVAILSDVIKPLFASYTEELMRRGEIDFTDAILQATKYCADGAWIEYDYVLVDEFQDISADRYRFLQSLRRQNPLTKLFCVGDDWQSIYRFSGSNMKLFYKFKEYFGFTEHCKIEKTYRFFNPLLDLSSGFIQRNPDQMRKNVQSNGRPMPAVAPEYTFTPTEVVEIDGRRVRFLSEDIPAVHEWLRNSHTSLEFYDCDISQSSGSMMRVVTSLVCDIPEDESILILGRYNYDACDLGYNLRSNDFTHNPERIVITINGRQIPFMSVHSAKGLEADNVILINCNEGIYGFPSLVEDDPILGYVLSEEDQYEYAEERRLFYVALTRAKRHMHILYNGDKPSPFVRELTTVLKANEHLCPLCQEGHIVVIKQDVAGNGNPYTIYGCSNSNAHCDYFERVFGDAIPRFISVQSRR